jgi:hypothetical protein
LQQSLAANNGVQAGHIGSTPNSLAIADNGYLLAVGAPDATESHAGQGLV